MMTQNISDIESLDRELRNRLIGIRRLSCVVHCLTIVVYAAVLYWVTYCIYTSFWGWRIGQGISDDAWIFIAGAFVVFLVLHFLLMYGLTLLKDRETQVMRKAIRHLFPDAVYSINSTISRSIIKDSALFDLFSSDKDAVDFTGYGSIVFRGESGSAAIYDIGVTSGRFLGIVKKLPAVGFLVTLYYSVVRPIFGAPIENSLHNFRGMFGMRAGSIECKGNVILLPDRLEDKIGYLAHSIQSYRNKNGARHVILEDVEFESLFAVYADDEVEARKILTPAMMQRITNLRRAFGKELLISFSGNRIYYAVSFPDGFLRPTRESLNNEKLFEQIFYEINLGRKLISQ